MKKLKLFYATNRNHEGSNQWRPERYGNKFSDSGIENLRFGKLTVEASENVIKKHLRTPAHNDHGDGESLADYISKKVPQADIRAYRESINHQLSEIAEDQGTIKLGSLAMFDDLQSIMKRSTDVLVYIHGFNVNWEEAVGAALALQEMLNRPEVGDSSQQVTVLLFTWPSDGMALPYVSYKSDRTEAEGSGYAVGRGFLKVRDFLAKLGDRPGGIQDPNNICGQDIHLLCHSMGNYVLQNALARLQDMQGGRGLPRLFEHIFMCAPDVDDDILEANKTMSDLHRLSRSVSVYHNRGDLAMYVSDYSKGNPERLGTNGTAHPGMVHNKIHQIDCTPIVKGFVEHSYYLWGPVNTDIRLSVDSETQDSPARTRCPDGMHDNSWVLK